MEIEEIQQTNKTYTGCLIFLHGATRNAKYQKEEFNKLLGNRSAFKHIKVIFPNSPVKYFTYFKKVTSIWFDTSPPVGNEYPKASVSDIDSSCQSLQQIIEQEQKNGIPIKRIIIGGISQGGMISFHAVYRFYSGVAGCVGISACLPEEQLIYDGIKKSDNIPPSLICNGDADKLLPFEWGVLASQKLVNVGVASEFVAFPGAQHDLTVEELELVYKWVENLIPEI